MKIAFSINGKKEAVEIEDENTPLVWVIRDTLDLKGTKYGCGKSACGACTVWSTAKKFGRVLLQLNMPRTKKLRP